jgi:gas vesicle protein
MKRLIFGLLILGAILAVVAAIMKRQSGSDAGWDELTRDTVAEASDATAEAKEAMGDAAKAAADDVTVIVEDVEPSSS